MSESFQTFEAIPPIELPDSPMLIVVDEPPQPGPPTDGPHFYTFQAVKGGWFGDAKYRFEVWSDKQRIPTFLGVYGPNPPRIAGEFGKVRSPAAGAKPTHSVERSLKAGPYYVVVWTPSGGGLYHIKVSKKKGWFG